MGPSTEASHLLPFASDPALQRRFLASEVPRPGNLRFGLLLEVLDALAEDVALEHVRITHPEARVVTAAVDSIQVRGPADPRRDLRCLARVNWVGRTSLEVGIRVAHPGDALGPEQHVASCYFTMVARPPDEGPSLPLPPLVPATPQAQRRWDRAQARKDRARDATGRAAAPPDPEEYAALQALHQAQEDAAFGGLLARDLLVETWERTYPELENVPRKIFGGHLIHRAFEGASLCAERVAPDTPLVVGVNRINFHQPVRMGDTLRFLSRAIHSGRNSVTVQTQILRRSVDRTLTALSNTCAFTFVNVAEGLVPRPVPAVHPTTYREDALWLEAHRGRKAHLDWVALGRP